jgi:plasmid maintenance system antidote protein VapI
MTKSVIRQDAKLEIDTEMVINHLAPMSAAPKSRLSQATLAEMKPERIGYRLQLLREALELKPSEISDMLGMPRTYWSRFENGNRAITDAFAALLVERFGVSLDFLILGRWDRLPMDLAEKMRRVDSSKNN